MPFRVTQVSSPGNIRPTQIQRQSEPQLAGPFRNNAKVTGQSRGRPRAKEVAGQWLQCVAQECSWL